MPELPEVQTIVDNLKDQILNKTIDHVDVRNATSIEGDANNFISILKGKTIKDIRRKGKFLVFFFNSDDVMISHLRMEGKYYFYEDGTDKFNRHDMVVFYFSDLTTLIYNDTRHFGRIELRKIDNYLTTPPLINVGQDPFEINDKNKKEIYKKLSSCKKEIKAALLDQSIISGLGNIYVDEVLFATSINPKMTANQLNSPQFDHILKESQRILANAIKSKGSTIKSYHPGLNQSGSFQEQLLVYGKAGEKCPNCNHRLNKIRIGGRGTTYCPHCQNHESLPLAVALTGPIGSGKSEIAKVFIDQGFKDIDTDKIVADLYKEKDVQAKLVKLFGDEVIKEGEVDRKLITSVILKDKKVYAKLNKLIHPLVKEKVEEILDKAKTGDKFIVEVPLLYESKIDEMMNYTIYVDIDRDRQIKNLISRSSNPTTSLEINSSYDKENNKKIADIILVNDGDLNLLRKKAKEIICKDLL